MKIFRDNRGANLVIALIALAGFKFFGKTVDKKINDQAGKVETIGN